MVSYKSTRGGISGQSFEKVLLATYAPDGGLYVPERLPMLTSAQLLAWRDFTLGQICAEIMQLFTDIPIEDLRVMTAAAFIFGDMTGFFT